MTDAEYQKSLELLSVDELILLKEELGSQSTQNLSWGQFVKYNVLDCQLVAKLEDKLKMLDLALTISFLAKINFDNVFGPVRTWDSIIHNALRKEKKVIPLKDMDGGDHEGIEGAYVKDPKIGFVRWPISIDAESLYPSNAIMLNMSPETYLGIIECSLDEMLRGDSPEPPEMECLSPIGARFNKEFQGIIPRLFEGLKVTRKEVKKEMLRLKLQLELVEKELQSRSSQPN